MSKISMTLGKNFQFQISTNDAGRSLSFYKLLGFQDIANGKKPFRWIFLSNGTLNIILAEEEFYGLTYFLEDMEEKVDEVKGKGIEFIRKDLKMDDRWYKVIKDPNDFLIAMVNDLPEYFTKINKYDFNPIGRFKEISLLSEKIKDSVEFWKKLGYEIQPDEYAENSPISLNDGIMNIGLYSKNNNNHYFEAPAITLIDKNITEKIKELKEGGLKFQEELENKDGITGAIALSPEGQTFFLFNK